MELFLEEIDTPGGASRGGPGPGDRKPHSAASARGGIEASLFARFPVLSLPLTDFDQLPSNGGLIKVTADDLTPNCSQPAILPSGCLLIRGLIEEEEVTRLVAEIDSAYEARDALSIYESAVSDYFEPFVPDPRFDLAFDRAIVGSGGAGGLWGVDSPPVMLDVLDAFERTGLPAHRLRLSRRASPDLGQQVPLAEGEPAGVSRRPKRREGRTWAPLGTRMARSWAASVP